MERQQKQRTFNCVRASQEVTLSYTELTDDISGKARTGKRTCSGKFVCGMRDPQAGSDWSKCPHLP